MSVVMKKLSYRFCVYILFVEYTGAIELTNDRIVLTNTTCLCLRRVYEFCVDENAITNSNILFVPVAQCHSRKSDEIVALAYHQKVADPNCNLMEKNMMV